MQRGWFRWTEADGLLFPTGIADDYRGGRIERIDPTSGKVEILYEAAGGRRLSAPNDLIFDSHGGFWFTDTGASTATEQVHGGLYYAKADGSEIREAVFPLTLPNGVGLSPNGSILYVALTTWRDLRAFKIETPGQIATQPGGLLPGNLITSFDGNRMLDSLAIEANGNICVTPFLNEPGVTVIAPDGKLVEHVPFPDIMTTNICFGGNDMQTAYVTQSATGKLLALDWPRPGLRLPHTP